MNNLDGQYQALLQYIINHGTKKETRNGSTISVFGRQIRHKMSEGFPLLTTKKMAFKTMSIELIWFLRGDTNIKFLVDNNCHIWDGDAYKRFLNETIKIEPVEVKERAIAQLLNSKESKEEFINKIKTDDEFAKKWGELGPIYGKQWRSWGRSNVTNYDLKDVTGADQYKIIKAIENGEDVTKYGVKIEYQNNSIDQIANLIRDLKTNPDSRRLMVSAYNVGELDSMVLPPCHYGFQVYTRELSYEERCDIFKPNTKNFRTETNSGIKDLNIKIMNDTETPIRAISLMWNQRSVDTFLGLPFNIASYGLLLEIIAKSVNMVPDELIGNLGDTHLYSNHIEQAEDQISRTSYPLPKLNINTEWWPYEGGSCGEGPLDAAAVFNSFKDDNFCKCLLEEDIQLSNYQSHPSIKAPLSN